jgi:hypothetical protein
VTLENSPDSPAEKRDTASFTWIYLVAFVLALVTLGIGIYELSVDTKEWTMLAAGCVSLVVVFAAWPLALTINGARTAARRDADEVSLGVTERLDQMSILMNLMSEQQLLSDRAKSVAFREKDRDALRRAIQEEMARQDWEAAFVLADEIERGFGYRAEADRFREEIKARRQETVRKQVADATAVIDRHTRGEQWTAAMREAERLQNVYPDNEQVRNLPMEIDARRQAHKKRLLDSWNDAVARHDVDGSIEILKQLDTYLTPAEASSMQETARGVFKEKLNNLGKQFSTAVQEHKWAESIRLGETIMRDFPNSRIAQEVKEKMDHLRQRAAETGGAGSTAATAAAPA